MKKKTAMLTRLREGQHARAGQHIEGARRRVRDEDDADRLGRARLDERVGNRAAEAAAGHAFGGRHERDECGVFDRDVLDYVARAAGLDRIAGDGRGAESKPSQEHAEKTHLGLQNLATAFGNVHEKKRVKSGRAVAA